jgi:4-diphosphocytidyl-2-C-methyl-D-erythritol kinase
MNSMTPLGSPEPWPAPGKLNLCLHVVGRRPDGYHLLQSAMQFIDLADELRFFVRSAGIIERIRGPQRVPAESDLVVRAAHRLAQETDRSQGIAIDLEKRIPMQAGLGGGSSDAATVLVALNQLWGLGFSTEKLAEIGVQLMQPGWKASANA